MFAVRRTTSVQCGKYDSTRIGKHTSELGEHHFSVVVIDAVDAVEAEEDESKPTVTEAAQIARITGCYFEVRIAAAEGLNHVGSKVDRSVIVADESQEWSRSAAAYAHIKYRHSSYCGRSRHQCCLFTSVDERRGNPAFVLVADL
jgi:hypothetical protein